MQILNNNEADELAKGSWETLSLLLMFHMNCSFPKQATAAASVEHIVVTFTQFRNQATPTKKG